MFYGLNSLFKKILPKRLFYRSLIIVATPIILLQIIITVVFFDSLWIKANKGMTRSLVSEIRTLYDVYKNPDVGQKQSIINLYNKNFDFVIKFKTGEKFEKKNEERWYSPMDRSLRRELKSAFGSSEYSFDTTKYKKFVEVKIRYTDGYLEIFFPKNRIAPSSARIFALWITLPGLLLIMIAIVFLKNQTRPIVNLAKAAEKFGKGEYVKEFRPTGAKEIRLAAYEFDKMRKRITIHLNQRSEMLSGISHDLRTPLTRLKLQLAMVNQKDVVEKMSKDIDEMSKMLNDYLQFAKTQSQEDTTSINLNKLIENIEREVNNNNLTVRSEEEINIKGRNNALKRCIQNVIQNALDYGKKVYVTLQKTNTRIIVIVEDDGPGIPPDQYKNVFKPFFRLDKSRSLNKSGVGLGLAIVEDIVNSHGGNIQLSKSDMNGLQVKISLPF